MVRMEVNETAVRRATGQQVSGVAMKLMTKELERAFQKTGRQEGGDPVVVAKFFTPWTSWTWYATEYDPETRVFFGFVVGLEKEWGSFSLDEMASVTGPFGLKIERDLYFRPTRFSQLNIG